MNRHLFFGALLLLFTLPACEQHNEAGTADEVSLPLPPAEPLEKRLTYGEYQLIAKTTQIGDQTSLAIRGLVGENPLNSPVNRKVGRIADVEIADLNEDGKPEVYVFDQSTDGQFFGRILAFGFSPPADWSEIAVEEWQQELQQGYRGHDQFRIENRKIVRSFPIHEGNAGKEHTIEYILQEDAAGLRLRISK